MTVPKPNKPLLTATERERLYRRDDEDSSIRKRNDMIVRNKLLSWLRNADDALLALERLPLIKLRKELRDSDVYILLEIVRELLDLLDFGRIIEIKGNTIVIKSIYEHHNPNIGARPTKTHPATKSDFGRIFRLEPFARELMTLVEWAEKSTVYKQYKDEQHHKLSDNVAAMIVNGKVPSESEFWNEKGLYFLLDESDDPEEAVKYFDKAIDLDPNNAKAWMDKGCAFGKLARYEDAVNCYNKVIELDPSNKMGWFQRGSGLITLEENEEAIKSFEKTLEIDPSYADAWFLKSCVLLSLERYEESIQAYDKAIESGQKEFYGWNIKAEAREALSKNPKARGRPSKIDDMIRKFVTK